MVGYTFADKGGIELRNSGAPTTMQQPGPWADMEPVDVAVIGAGVIGACVARELSRRGASVAVLERDGAWGSGCSFGNAGWLCPSHAGHFASRGDLAQALRWLLRHDSPFGIKPRPALLRFGAQLLLATRPSRVARTAELLRELSIRSLAAHAEMARSGLDTGFSQAGLLDVYATERSFRRARAALAEPSRIGFDSIPLSPADVADEEPCLSEHCAGAVLHPHDAHCDPYRFVRAIGKAAEAQGTSFLPGVPVCELSSRPPGVRLHTPKGTLAAHAVVIAAGAWSAGLVRQCGKKVALEAGKGYSLDLEFDRGVPVRRPVMLQEERVAVTPLSGRLRLAGTMQFDGLDLGIEPRRTESIRAAAIQALPASAAGRTLTVWSGLRPCTPDGLPMIGWLPSAVPVVLAVGHAMLGLTLAPVTAELVADLLDGRPAPELDAMAVHPGTRSRLFKEAMRGQELRKH